VQEKQVFYILALIVITWKQEHTVGGGNACTGVGVALESLKAHLPAKYRVCPRNPGTWQGGTPSACRKVIVDEWWTVEGEK
jgi:hypothetical protein